MADVVKQDTDLRDQTIHGLLKKRHAWLSKSNNP